MNMHNRLSIRSIVFANCGPMSTNSQHFNTIDVEVCFTRNWGLLGDCLTLLRISGGYSQEMMGFVSLGFRKFKSRSSKNTPEML